MSDLLHLPAHTSPDTICDVIDEHGGVIVDELLDIETLTTLEAELRPYLEACDSGTNAFAGFRTKRIGALIARSPTSRSLATHPLVTAASSQYLAPYCDHHQLHFSQAVAIGQGEGAQMLHRDRGVWGATLTRAVETQFSTIWALTDFTHQNGATRIVPGSHRWDKDRQPADDEIVSAEMRAGSVLLYNGTVIHGGGENTTPKERVGVLLHYTLNWLRQEENQYLSCPPSSPGARPSAAGADGLHAGRSGARFLLDARCAWSRGGARASRTAVRDHNNQRHRARRDLISRLGFAACDCPTSGSRPTSHGGRTQPSII